MSLCLWIIDSFHKGKFIWQKIVTVKTVPAWSRDKSLKTWSNKTKTLCMEKYHWELND